MNTLFIRQIPLEITNEPAQVAPPSVFLENPETRTFGFVMKGKSRPGVVPELTLQDRRELAALNIGNVDLAEKAKRIYAAGGGIKTIADRCNISPSYAKQIHMCFGRAIKHKVKNRY